MKRNCDAWTCHSGNLYQLFSYCVCQYWFLMPDAKVFLLSGVYQDGSLSIVTCEPNSAVAHVHARKPLALGLGESTVWLVPGLEVLADRSCVRLVTAPER